VLASEADAAETIRLRIAKDARVRADASPDRNTFHAIFAM
jgi:hypothetical protein